MKAEPKLIIIAAPSGTGKSTLAKKFLGKHPNHVAFSVSSTTRAPRGEEQHGREYFFISVDEFKKGIADGRFAEWAEVHGRFYGTSKEAIESNFKKGKSVLLDIDVQGAESLRKIYPGKIIDIFISPPSLEVLEKRLRERGTDSKEVIAKRLANAKSEMARMNEFTHILINDDLARTYENYERLILEGLGLSKGRRG